MNIFSSVFDYIPEPVSGLEPVTNKLMNVVMCIENLTPGETLLENLNTGEVYPLKLHVWGFYNLESHKDTHVLVGHDRVNGKVGLRVNMGRDMLRRIEFMTPEHRVWRPYLLSGYVRMLLPTAIVDRVFSAKSSQTR